MASLRLRNLIKRSAKAQESRDKNGDICNKHQLQWLGLEKYNRPVLSDVGYKAFLRPLHRNYFSRGWITLEAALARECTRHVGAATFDFIDFVCALMCCHSLGFEDDCEINGGRCFLNIFVMRIAPLKNQHGDLLSLSLCTRSNCND